MQARHRYRVELDGARSFPCLDRLDRNLKHLVTLLEELQALGVAFVSLGEGLDATTPAIAARMCI